MPFFSDASAWRDRTIPMERLVHLAPRWGIGTAVATIAPHTFLWGLPDVGLADVPLLLLEALGLLAVYVLSVPAHEGLHALAMRLFGGVAFADVSFHVQWRQGIAYVHTERPMTTRAYRLVLLFPTLVLALPPLAAGLAVGWGWGTLYGWLMLASALGDFTVLGLLRGLPPHTLVRDHPSAAGCLILDAPPEALAREVLADPGETTGR